MSNSQAPGGRLKRLADIVRDARIAAAERQDTRSAHRDGERARLELLADALKPVFDDVPADDDQFDFYLSSGERPRLWIDAIAHVHLGNDARTYRFVRDTRYGRVVLTEDAEMARVCDAVARYVADCIVKRQHFLESDDRSVRTSDAKKSVAAASSLSSAEDDAAPAKPAADTAAAPKPVESKMRPREFGIAAALLWFLFGIAVASAVWIALLWELVAERISAL
ncbi:MAG: hypothetical protein AAF724_10695 [Pseudomonadota bacterium]